MKEISKYNKTSYNFNEMPKTEKYNYSKLETINKTLNSEINNINKKTNLFTNEFLIKSIIKSNNMSSYSTFFRKLKIVPKHLLVKKNKYSKKDLKKKLLLITDNTSSFFNKTNSYLSGINNTHIVSSNKTNYFTNLIKNNSNFYSNKKINLGHSDKSEKILSKVEKDNNKKKKEMKILKFRLNKLLSRDSLNICETFDKKNDLFNIKLKNYLNSDKYIKGKKLEHDKFNNNKKEFSSSHNILNYYYEPPIDKKSNEELMACTILNNLSDKDKKIISLNPKYFLIDKKKILAKKLNIVINESLKDRIIREEQKEILDDKNKKNKSIIVDINKTDFNNKIKKIFNKKLIKRINIVNEKKINNQINRYHQEIIKTDSKKKISDYINSEINNSYKEFQSFCRKNYSKYNQFKEGDYYYKIFNYPLNYKMTREYALTKNNTRLNYEENFHILREKNKEIKENSKNKVKNCQNIIKLNYKRK